MLFPLEDKGTNNMWLMFVLLFKALIRSCSHMTLKGHTVTEGIRMITYRPYMLRTVHSPSEL